MFFLQATEAVEDYHHVSLYQYQQLVDYYPIRRKFERNEQIMAQYQAGASISALADQFRISTQRVHQIIRGN